MHRRVDVAEVPLIGRQLAVRVQVVVAQHQVELLLGEVGIDHAQRDHVEGQVPGRVPRVLPLVRHRDDVVIEHVRPLAVAHALALLPGQMAAGAMLVEPQVEVVVEVLLGPEHAGQRLAQHVGAVGVLRDSGRGQRRIEGIGFGQALCEYCVEVGEGRARLRRLAGRQPQAQDLRLARADTEAVVGRHLGALPRRIHRSGLALHEVAVEGVLHVGRRILAAEKAHMVGLVLGEEQRHVTLDMQVVVVQRFLEQCIGVMRMHHRVACTRDLLQFGLRTALRCDQVLRNHSVGSTCSGAASGPRLATVMRTSTSSGAAFAYSTKTSK